MSTVIGALRYDIVADTSQFTQGMVLSRKELAAGRKIMEATTTDTELMGKRLQSLDRLRAAGAIDQQAYNRSLTELHKNTDQARQAQEQAAQATKMQDAAKQEAAQITNRLATAEERYAVEVGQLNQHLAAGRITQQTYNRALADAQSRLPAVQRAERARAEAMRQTEQWSRRLENAEERHHRQLRELAAAYRQGHVNQRLYERGLNNLEREYRQVSQAASRFHAVGQRVNRIMDFAAGGLVAHGVMQVKHALGGTVRANEEFQQAMASSLAIAGDVSDGMREKLTTASQQIAFNTKFSSTEAAGSIEFLQLAGLSLEQSLETMPQVAKFAQAGMFDLATATDLATDTQAAMGLNSADTQQHLQGMANVTDVLTKASTVANANIEQFASAITSGAGPAARQVGMDIEETAAVLSAFASTGFAKGEEAGTQFGTVMRDLQTKAIGNKQAFREAGIAVFDAGGDFQKMSNIIGDVERHLAGMSDEQQKATILQLGFSDKSVKSIQALLGQSEAIAGYEAKLREAGGTTDEVANKQMPPLTRALNELGATWSVFTELSVNPMVDSMTEANRHVGIFTTGLAAVLDASDMIQKGWYYINVGIETGALGVKTMLSTMIDMVTQPLALIQRMVEMMEALGLAPEFATDIAQQIGDLRESVADSFSVADDWERMKAEAKAFDAQFAGPSSGDRFLARMAEVSKPLAVVPQPESMPAPPPSPFGRGDNFVAMNPVQLIHAVMDGRISGDKFNELAKQFAPLKSFVITQEQAARNTELAALTQAQLFDAVMDGKISESEFDRFSKHAQAERIEEPAKNEAQASIATAARGSSEAYRIITEMMRAQQAQGKEEKIVEATERGNAHLEAVKVNIIELNQRIGSVG